METVTKDSIRWYKMKTGLVVFICTILGSCLSVFGAFFGAELLFEWLRQRDRKIQYMEGQLKSNSASENLICQAKTFEWGTLTMIDQGKGVCPTCGTEVLLERLNSSEPQLCMNLQDIHPHYITDPAPVPNPWAWSWYQRNGYKPPMMICNRVYTPPESLHENPAKAMAEAGRVYWMEHRNYFWDNAYAEVPQWYINRWLNESITAA